VKIGLGVPKAFRKLQKKLKPDSEKHEEELSLADGIAFASSQKKKA